MEGRTASDHSWAMTTTTSRADSGIAAHVRIRPLTPADRDALAAAFARLSDDTRWRRFGALASHLGQRDLDRLTQIDHHDHEALLAIAPGTERIVGVARYIAFRDDLDSAEVAVAVDDDWQNLGIGRRLVAELSERARAEGITQLLAHVAPDNRRVIDWVTRAGGIIEDSDRDAIRFSVALDRADVRRAA
jgi:ribosomal protein S18 acetylase RimI-like enzyme